LGVSLIAVSQLCTTSSISLRSGGCSIRVMWSRRRWELSPGTGFCRYWAEKA
jgi:hypothetical protein